MPINTPPSWLTALMGRRQEPIKFDGLLVGGDAPFLTFPEFELVRRLLKHKIHLKKYEYTIKLIFK